MGRSSCCLRLPILFRGGGGAQVQSPSSLHRYRYSSSFDQSRSRQINVPAGDEADGFTEEGANNSSSSSSNSSSSVHGNGGNRVMVVVDSTREARGALQWTLSHAVRRQDVISLLLVIKQAKEGEDPNREHYLKAYRVLHYMQNICQLKKPGVQVEVSIVEGQEKGPTIVKEAKRQGASVLVLGKRKRPVMWKCLLRVFRRRKASSDEVVEYCIKNATSMTIAVRRKRGKHGGYLITTKRHRNFWLLA